MSDPHYERKVRTNDSDVSSRKIFIGGLSYSTDDDNLRRYFSPYGSIDDAVVMKDPVTKRSRGFGFITFSTIQSVDQVLLKDPHVIDGRRVEVKRSVPKVETAISPNASTSPLSNKSISSQPNSPTVPSSPTQHTNSVNYNKIKGQFDSPINSAIKKTINQQTPRQSSNLTSNVVIKSNRSNEGGHVTNRYMTLDEYNNTKIFVGGLHYDIRDDDFISYFQQYGKVLSGEVMFNRETHKSRGFGFIIYETIDGVDRVCEQTNHVIHGKAVEVKRAIPRSLVTPGTTLSPITSSTPSSPQISPTPSIDLSTQQSGITRARGLSVSSTTATTSSLLNLNNSPNLKSLMMSYANILKSGSSNSLMDDTSEIDNSLLNELISIDTISLSDRVSEIDISGLSTTNTTIYPTSLSNRLPNDITMGLFGDSSRNRALSEPIVHGFYNQMNSSINTTTTNDNLSYNSMIYDNNVINRPSSLSFDNTNDRYNYLQSNASINSSQYMTPPRGNNSYDSKNNSNGLTTKAYHSPFSNNEFDDKTFQYKEFNVHSPEYNPSQVYQTNQNQNDSFDSNHSYDYDNNTNSYNYNSVYRLSNNQNYIPNQNLYNSNNNSNNLPLDNIWNNPPHNRR